MEINLEWACPTHQSPQIDGIGPNQFNVPEFLEVLVPDWSWICRLVKTDHGGVRVSPGKIEG